MIYSENVVDVTFIFSCQPKHKIHVIVEKGTNDKGNSTYLWCAKDVPIPTTTVTPDPLETIHETPSL